MNNLQTNLNRPIEDDAEDNVVVVSGEREIEIKPEDQEIRNGFIKILNGTFDSSTKT